MEYLSLVDFILDTKRYDEAYEMIVTDLTEVSKLYPSFNEFLSKTVYDGVLARSHDVLYNPGKWYLILNLRKLKLCTLYIVCKGRCYGPKVFKLAIERFEAVKKLTGGVNGLPDKITVYVCDDKLKEFKRILKHLGFEYVSSIMGLHREGVYEHFFEKPI